MIVKFLGAGAIALVVRVAIVGDVSSLTDLTPEAVTALPNWGYVIDQDQETESYSEVSLSSALEFSSFFSFLV